MKKIRIWLSHPKLPLFLVLLAVGLTFPSLWNGLCFDDNFHKIVLLGKVPLSEHTSSPFNLFFFSDGDVRQARQGMNSGSIPWWTDEKFQVNFLRPVTSLTHWVDYQLWPDIPALMHLQSLMWFGILVALLALFYRRIMGVGWVAGLVVAFPRETVRLYDLMCAGQWKRARDLYEWFLPMLHLDIGPKFIQQIKAVEEIVGVGSARVRPPRLLLNEEDMVTVREVVEEALANRPEL